VTQDGEKVTIEVAQKQLHYFPITPLLKWLFISKRTARHMRWHKEGIHENDRVMGHPSDDEGWKVLDEFDADFANDARNIRFELATEALIHAVPTPHHTLACPSLLCRTTYHHLFI
jgi:hypothetical protein